MKRYLLQPRVVERALQISAGVVALALVASVAQAGWEWWAGRRLHRVYAELTGTKPTATAASPRDELIKRVSENRLIAPPEPPMQLSGVLGDSAIFNGAQLVKVGQSAGKMKVLAIGGDWVEVETDGQKRKLYVFEPMPAPAPGMIPPGMVPSAAVAPGMVPPGAVIPGMAASPAASSRRRATLDQPQAPVSATQGSSSAKSAAIAPSDRPAATQP